jgi:cytochrome c553
MRLLLLFVLVLVFAGCENKTTTVDNTPNTEKENDQAKTIFQNKCERCHGENASSKALNVSDIIAYYNKNEIIEALTLYKKGERNRHRFGHLMKGIIDDMTDEEINILADYIANLEQKSK